MRMAGRALVVDGLATSQRLQRVDDDEERWLWFLVEVGNESKSTTITSSSPTGPITTHEFWLHDVVAKSLTGVREALVRSAAKDPRA